MVADVIKLQRAMLETGIERGKLIKKSGLSRTTISYILTGKDVKKSTLMRVAKALNVDLSDIADVPARAQECDRDCFNCKFEDCVREDVDEDELSELDEAERTAGIYIPPKAKKGEGKYKKRQLTDEQKEQRRQKKREYYRKNRDYILQWQRDYERLKKEKREAINTGR